MIDAIDFEQGKAARAHDEMCVAMDRAAFSSGIGVFDPAATVHAMAVNVLLCADERTDVSGSPARRAYYGVTA